MQTKGRAFFNLVQMGTIENPEIAAESWQVENYRKVPLEELFTRLAAFHISLNKQSFTEYANQCDSPEELTEALWLGEEDPSEYSKIYLLVFELWRRLEPGKQSLSLFCDELDHLIHLYDKENLSNDELLQAALSELERILDESSDRGQPPKEVFKVLSEYCAHDLESFIYDYAAAQMDIGNRALASELIDGFLSYVKDEKWFQFLRVRLLFDADEEESCVMLERLMERLQDEPELDLLLEIARFSASEGLKSYFFRAIIETKPFLRLEEDFQELLEVSSEFFHFFEEGDLYRECIKLLERRAQISAEKELRNNDRDLSAYFSLISNFQRSKV